MDVTRTDGTEHTQSPSAGRARAREDALAAVDDAPGAGAGAAGPDGSAASTDGSTASPNGSAPGPHGSEPGSNGEAPGFNGSAPVVGRLGPLARLAPEPMKVVLNWGRRYSLWVFNFGLACCAIEFIAASMARHDFIRLGVIPFAPGPRQADMMVVSGTLTDKMAPAIKRLYEQMPEPKYVISFGACSNCGGPYWDSYSVTKGVDQIIPVDVYVPGCPPRPEALLQGILKLQEKIARESLGERYNDHGAPTASTGALRSGLVTPPAPPSGDEPARKDVR